MNSMSTTDSTGRGLIPNFPGGVCSRSDIRPSQPIKLIGADISPILRHRRSVVEGECVKRDGRSRRSLGEGGPALFGPLKLPLAPPPGAAAVKQLQPLTESRRHFLRT